ncbi:MAG: hypothetical protein GX549_01160 [Clostridiales bacterium]|jgi:hypothetical protein|nr:hypothetical protein [Clostridiales bacterium]
MDLSDSISQSIERIGVLTPLRSDCGRLCGAACCQGNEAGQGMLVYPGELLVRSFPQSWRRERVTLPGYGSAPLICCDGPCEREERPLACRVFPLAPRLRPDGSFGVRMNPRGRPVCPLCHKPVSSLDPAFARAVEDVFSILSSHPEGKRFLTALSRMSDVYDNPFSRD